MTLFITSIAGACVFKLFSHRHGASIEVCPVPFYGNDELADAFAQAFANKK